MRKERVPSFCLHRSPRRPRPSSLLTVYSRTLSGFLSVHKRLFLLVRSWKSRSPAFRLGSGYGSLVFFKLSSSETYFEGVLYILCRKTAGLFLFVMQFYKPPVPKLWVETHQQPDFRWVPQGQQKTQITLQEAIQNGKAQLPPENTGR